MPKLTNGNINLGFGDNFVHLLFLI